MDLLILGASARAAAFSALRLGLRPVCGDLFADADLASACPSTRIEPDDYPEGLATFAQGLSPTSWLYTGAIENRPDLVDRISSHHRLLGNPGAMLRAVRDPFAVAEALRGAGLVAPELRVIPDQLPEDGSWLVKPRASGGGRGISPWLGDPSSLGRSFYYQERIEGLSLAALFVGTHSTSRCLGITRQFVGTPRSPFAYWGSFGPWPVADEIHEQVERIGQVIASKFGLLGIFGVDLILQGRQAWPIEVNPRYTASVEVIEWAKGRSLMADHLRAFGWGLPIQVCHRRPLGFVGKVIVFADHPILWRGHGADFRSAPASFPETSDVPHPGTTFEVGDPVLTVMASGDSPGGCWERLTSKVRDCRLHLRSCEVKPGY